MTFALRCLPLFALCAVPLPGWAQEAREVPPWAEDWRYIWKDALENGALRLEGAVTHPTVELGDTELFAVLEVRSINFPQDRRPPVNAALVLDGSSSMKGGRLNVLKKAATDVVSVLGPKDRLAIIRVSDETDVFASQPCTPENKEAMLAFIRALEGRGGSDLSAGLADAYEQLLSSKSSYVQHRAILISDGRPNKGMADPDGLADIARRVRESENILTSTLTIGKDSDLKLMQGIATSGWGFTGNLEDASHVFRVGKRLTTDLIRKAADRVELTVRLAESVTLRDVLEHAADVTGNTLTIPLHELAHNERLRVVLRLSVLTQTGEGSEVPLLTARLGYHDGLIDRQQEAELALSATVSLDPQKVTRAISLKTLEAAARSVTDRAIARAQDRADEGYTDEAARELNEVSAFLQKTGRTTGLATGEAQKAVEEARARLIPKTPEKKKRRRR